MVTFYISTNLDSCEPVAILGLYLLGFVYTRWKRKWVKVGRIWRFVHCNKIVDFIMIYFYKTLELPSRAIVHSKFMRLAIACTLTCQKIIESIFHILRNMTDKIWKTYLEVRILFFETKALGVTENVITFARREKLKKYL